MGSLPVYSEDMPRGWARSVGLYLGFPPARENIPGGASELYETPSPPTLPEETVQTHDGSFVILDPGSLVTQLAQLIEIENGRGYAHRVAEILGSTGPVNRVGANQLLREGTQPLRDYLTGLDVGVLRSIRSAILSHTPREPSPEEPRRYQLRGQGLRNYRPTERHEWEQILKNGLAEGAQFRVCVAVQTDVGLTHMDGTLVSFLVPRPSEETGPEEPLSFWEHLRD